MINMINMDSPTFIIGFTPDYALMVVKFKGVHRLRRLHPGLDPGRARLHQVFLVSSDGKPLHGQRGNLSKCLGKFLP